MSKFIDSLESRRLMSGSGNLFIDQGLVVGDISKIAADAKSASTTLRAEVKSVVTELKHLNVQHSPLVTTLQKAISTATSTIAKDVSNIVSAGAADGTAVVSDLLNIYLFDAGSSTAVAKDKVQLTADVTALKNVETPLVNNLKTDLSNSEKAIQADVQAIVNSYKSDATLQKDWTALTNTVHSTTTTLSNDFTALVTDVKSLIQDA